jgi:integrase
MLSQDVNRYVELHRVMGFKFRTQHSLLRNFVRFADQHGDSHVRTPTVLDWAAQAPSPPQRHNRLATVRRFALAMQTEDARHQVPPADVFGREWFKRRIPHIYTREEIARLINAAAQLPPTGSIRSATYSTLFGLLAATGLRISEALALELDDFTADGLLIRQTKFKKNRLVPLHETTRHALGRYLARRTRLPSAHSALFISLAGTALAYPTVIAVFLSPRHWRLNSLMRRLSLRSWNISRSNGITYLRRATQDSSRSRPSSASSSTDCLAVSIRHAGFTPSQ